MKPDYKRIYSDIIERKFPDKMKLCTNFFKKSELSIVDVIKLNNLLFDQQDTSSNKFDQQHRAYDEKAIIEILDFQKKGMMSNSELALHFKLSKNTVKKWKELFKHRSNNY